jgi:multidrug efflux pump subunit AcrA (membrane-fusion protein)
MRKNAVWWCGLAGLAVAIAGCGKDTPAPAQASASASAPAAAASGPPVSVSTVRASKRDVNVTLEATGTVSALNSVEVRPQVASTIAKVHIKEGQFVKAGTLLFTLDARADEVNVVKARAQLAKDQAALADAQRQLARSRELFAQNFISQGAVDTNQTLVESAAAVVAGAINVFPGSYVQPGGSPLVTITQIDPMAVSFNLPQRNLGDALQTLRAGGGSVAAILPEGSGELTGKLQFVDNAVDANSGTVKVKAVFDNRNEKLWPGAYVTVRLVTHTLKDAVTVPQAAIIQGARGRAVYVVGDDKLAALRPVEVVEAIGTEAVVKGVRPGERVVLDGRQNLRPGSAIVERSAGAASAPRRGASGAAGGAGSSASGAASGMVAGAAVMAEAK